MKHFLLYFLPAFSVACLILFFSLWQTSSLKYNFSPTPLPSTQQNHYQEKLSYQLPQVGVINVANPLWPFKALEEKTSYVFSDNHLTQAKKALFFADERLANAQNLFAQNMTDLAVATLVKPEKYLELASENEKLARDLGTDSRQFTQTLALASTAHKQIIDQIVRCFKSDTQTNKSGWYTACHQLF